MSYPSHTHLLSCLTLFFFFSVSSLYANLAYIQGLVPEASDYSLVYELEIADFNNFTTTVPYTTDNAATITDGSFNKIAYFMELDGEWVWVSMDAFTTQAALAGVPNTSAHTKQQTVTGMNVLSSAGASPTSVVGSNSGRVEFWNTGYVQSRSPFFPNDGIDAVFDYNDTNAGSGNYGSMQVHNVALGETIFGFNGWNGRTSDLGIGSLAVGQPDWTFAENAGSYTTKKIYTLVANIQNTFSLSSYPDSNEFYARDNDELHVTLPVVGTLETATISGLSLRILIDGVPTAADQPVSFTSVGNTRTFNTTVDIPAVLGSVSVQLIKIEPDSSEHLLSSSTGITVGDVYLIQGQSNADANMYVGSANANISPYIFTYGDCAVNAAQTQLTVGWKIAQGDGALWTSGGIGQWGLKMANELINAHQIPIAILNGAHPGQAMSFFQRNDADKGDLNTNYGRLYYRADQAGVRDNVKGIFYYQGESDLDDVTVWSAGWAALYADWKEDYPNVEKFYVVQVREGCGVTRFDLDLRDAQRRLQEQHADITTLTGLGLNGHDGCHYSFTDGYEELGVRFAKIISRDFYGAPDDPNIETIYPVFAELVGNSNNQIRIAVKRGDADITFQPGAEADFQVVGASVTVNSGSYANGFITLQLSGNASGATNILYAGRQQTGEWVTTSENNSLIAFDEPILAYVDTDSDDLSDNEELEITFTDPNLSDTDADGTPDNYEVALGLDPNEASSHLELDILNNTLRWPSREGLCFKLHYSDDLGAPANLWPSIMISDNDGNNADHYLYDFSNFPSSLRNFFALEMLPPNLGVDCNLQPVTLHSNPVEGNGDWSGAGWAPTTGPVFFTAGVGLSPTAGTEIMLLAENYGGLGTTTHSFTLGSAPASATEVDFSIDVGNYNNAPFPQGSITISIQNSSMVTIATLTGGDPATAEWETWSATLPKGSVPAGNYTALIHFTPTPGGVENAGVDNFQVTSSP